MWWFIAPLFLTSLMGLILGLLIFAVSYVFNSKFFGYLATICFIPLLTFIFLAPINAVWYLLVLIWSPFL